MRRVLNVGGNSKDIPLPEAYASFDHVLLDIDPAGKPDIVLDARELAALPVGGFDAVYCSHNLEHYFRHDVPRVLSGFLHVLKPGGFAQIRVPDIEALMRETITRNIDIDDILYISPAGPVMVHDVIYGHSPTIERSGVDFYAHRTGFTRKSLSAAVARAGFGDQFCSQGNLELNLIAFKGAADAHTRTLFGLPG